MVKDNFRFGASPSLCVRWFDYGWDGRSRWSFSWINFWPTELWTRNQRADMSKSKLRALVTCARGTKWDSWRCQLKRRYSSSRISFRQIPTVRSRSDGCEANPALVPRYSARSGPWCCIAVPGQDIEALFRSLLQQTALPSIESGKEERRKDCLFVVRNGAGQAQGCGDSRDGHLFPSDLRPAGTAQLLNLLFVPIMYFLFVFFCSNSFRCWCFLFGSFFLLDFFHYGFWNINLLVLDYTFLCFIWARVHPFPVLIDNVGEFKWLKDLQ